MDPVTIGTLRVTARRHDANNVFIDVADTVNKKWGPFQMRFEKVCATDGDVELFIRTFLTEATASRFQ